MILAKRKIKQLTTTDNPYDIRTDFLNWYMEDVRLGHLTCQKIAEMWPEGVSEWNQKEIEQANEAIYDEIIKNDPLGIYTLVEDEEDY